MLSLFPCLERINAFLGLARSEPGSWIGTHLLALVQYALIATRRHAYLTMGISASLGLMNTLSPGQAAPSLP
jgi:hypothetical protein